MAVGSQREGMGGVWKALEAGLAQAHADFVGHVFIVGGASDLVLYSFPAPRFPPSLFPPHRFCLLS